MLVRTICECGAYVDDAARAGIRCPRCGRDLTAPETIVDQHSGQPVGFEMTEPPKPKPPTPEDQCASIKRQLDGLVANTMRSVQALESRLKPDEQQQILDSIARAKRLGADATLDELESRLSEMSQAAGLIGQAMLRP